MAGRCAQRRRVPAPALLRADGQDVSSPSPAKGRPLRMRRYVFSESFAAIAYAAYAKATGDAQARRTTP